MLWDLAWDIFNWRGFCCFSLPHKCCCAIEAPMAIMVPSFRQDTILLQWPDSVKVERVSNALWGARCWFYLLSISLATVTIGVSLKKPCVNVLLDALDRMDAQPSR